MSALINRSNISILRNLGSHRSDQDFPPQQKVNQQRPFLKSESQLAGDSERTCLPLPANQVRLQSHFRGYQTRKDMRKANRAKVAAPVVVVGESTGADQGQSLAETFAEDARIGVATMEVSSLEAARSASIEWSCAQTPC